MLFSICGKNISNKNLLWLVLSRFFKTQLNTLPCSVCNCLIGTFGGKQHWSLTNLKLFRFLIRHKELSVFSEPVVSQSLVQQLFTEASGSLVSVRFLNPIWKSLTWIYSLYSLHLESQSFLHFYLLLLLLKYNGSIFLPSLYQLNQYSSFSEILYSYIMRWTFHIKEMPDSCVFLKFSLSLVKVAFLQFVWCWKTIH